MSGSQNLDRLVSEWLTADAPMRAPEYLHADISAAVQRTRQRPRWLAGLRIRYSNLGYVRPVVARASQLVAVTALVLLAVVAFALVVGSQRRLPPPFGIAGNGLMAFDSGGAIYTADSAGMVSVRVPADDRDRSGPNWSPDGAWLAYWSVGRDDTVSLGVSAADGTSTVEIALGVEADTDSRPDWSPDGRHLVVARAGRDGDGLYVVDRGTSVVRRLPVEDLQPRWPTWSPDGQWIAFFGTPEHTLDVGLYIVHPDGDGLSRLRTYILPEAIAEPGSSQWPQWAPDPSVSRLLYAFGPNGSANIAIFDLATQRETIVSNAVGNEFWPTWSPDGTRVAWYGEEAGLGAIRVADIGEGLTVIPGRSALVEPPSTDGEGDTCGENPSLAGRFVCRPPVWSPDGASIYAPDVLGTQILVVPVDGSTGPVGIPVPETALVSWQRIAP